MPLPTNTEVDAAVPVTGTPSRSLVNALLKKLTAAFAIVATSGAYADLTGTPAVLPFGPYTSVALLQAANPAATNIGKHATVSGVDYVSTGTTWIPSGAPTSIAWATTWKTDSNVDLGTFTITGALALASDDTGSVIGGSTQATLIANGTNAPTFDGQSSADWNNMSGTRNAVSLYRVGDTKYWVVGSGLAAAIAAPVIPSFSAVPVIAGTPTVGTASSYASGAYAGTPSPTITQQWTLDGVDISGATGATYTPISGDATHLLRVRQIAANGSGSANSTSVSATVSAGVAPTFSVAPAIIGTPTVGTASAYTSGTYAGTPTPAITQQWTLDGVDISGATAGTYTPVTGDIGHLLRVRQIATNTSGSANNTSASATVVSASATLLLDSVSGYTVVQALGHRKLRAAYAGSCIRVRRSSDNTEQDIGFSGQNLDTAALLAFAGSGDAAETTVYDQSGNARNWIQTTAGNQPLIVVAGVLNTKNSKPVARTVSTSNYFASSISLNPTANRYFFGVYSIDSATETNPIFIQSFNEFALGHTSGALQAKTHGTVDYGVPSTVKPAANTLCVYDAQVSSTATSYSIDAATTAPNGGSSTFSAATWSATTQFLPYQSLTGYFGESVIFDQAGAASNADRRTMAANSKAYWGTP